MTPADSESNGPGKVAEAADEGLPPARWQGWIRHLEDGLLALLLVAMILLAAGQILLRNLFEVGLPWIDPLLRVMVLWLGLLGAVAAGRDAKHIAIDALVRGLGRRARHAALACASLFTAGLSGLIAWHGARFVAMERELGGNAFAGLPAWVPEAIIPLAFGLLALRYALHFAAHLRGLAGGQVPQ
jgi:TRAP-type C4-dicarboxylate transport system permease small subunit